MHLELTGLAAAQELGIAISPHVGLNALTAERIDLLLEQLVERKDDSTIKLLSLEAGNRLLGKVLSLIKEKVDVRKLHPQATSSSRSALRTSPAGETMSRTARCPIRRSGNMASSVLK